MAPRAEAGRLRVAMVTNYPADDASFTGGVETATAALLEGLRELHDEVEVHVVSAPTGLPHTLREERDGVHFHFLATWRVLRPRLFSRVVVTRRELRRIRPDVVHAQDNIALALGAVLARFPRLFTVHGMKRHEASERTGWEWAATHVDAALERIVHRGFPTFICVSRYAASLLPPTAQTFAIPNPVSRRFFAAGSRRSLPPQPHLLFVGALAPLKRPADLLSAHLAVLREVPSLRTTFCGEVEDRGYAAALRRRAEADARGSVTFAGRVGREELASLVAHSTALVLPSAQENAPMVIAEAMAAGVPVIASRVGGIPEMVCDGETGLLFEAGDVEALTAQVRRMATDQALARRLGEHARRVAMESEPGIVARATLAAYRGVVAANGCVG